MDWSAHFNNINAFALLPDPVVPMIRKMRSRVDQLEAILASLSDDRTADQEAADAQLNLTISQEDGG
jgi:hypothetical protein